MSQFEISQASVLMFGSKGWPNAAVALGRMDGKAWAPSMRAAARKAVAKKAARVRWFKTR